MKNSMFLLMILAISGGWGQESRKPVVLDKEVLSGIGLEKVVRKDNPERRFYQKRLFRGDDLSAYVVSSETGTNDFDNFPIDEFIYMFNGEAEVLAMTKDEQHFYERDFFFAPKGFTGDWHIEAGDHLHYELSVISTQRADSTRIQPEQQHLLFDKKVLSGARIKLDEQGLFEDTLVKGAELTVLLKAEKPSQRPGLQTVDDKLVCLLSGQIEITHGEGQVTTAYSGDFLLLPKNLSYTWQSKGHELVKYVQVEKTIW